MHYAKLSRALLDWTNDAEGQALAEYGLILALIAVVAIAALGFLGLAIAGQLDAITVVMPFGGGGS